MKALSFGEILWDVYPDTKAIGGASLNLAAHLAQLGCESYIASAVGNDELGVEALNVIKKLNVKDDFIARLGDKKTGIVAVTLNERGVPAYEIKKDVAYDFIPAPISDEENFNLLTFGTLALRSEYNESSLSSLLSSRSFSEIYTDLNIRLPHSNKESSHFCLSHATIVKISDEELPTVSDWIFKKDYAPEDFAKKTASEYPQIKLVIVTMGEKGSFAIDTKNGKIHRSAAIPTDVISTVGAGDSFGAAFLTKYFEGKPIDECLKFASRISSFVCSKKEAVPELSEII